MTNHTVLQISDIAGVARSIEAAMRAIDDWTVHSISLPQARTSGRRRWVDVPRRAVQTRGEVYRTAAVLEPDVVHLHWARFAPLLGRPGGRPTIVHAHGSDVRGQRNTPLGRLVGRALKNADLVLASTPDLLDDLPPRAQYFPNPIDVTLFTSPSTERDRPRQRVLFFAQMNPVKGAQTLIAAAEQLHRWRPDVELVGIEGGRFDQQARAAGIELWPRQARQQLAPLLQSADVVVGQMHLGAVGLSELEAMACARPVVCQVRAGLYSAPPPVSVAESAAEVADQVIEILASPNDAARQGAEARQYVLDEHDYPVVARRLRGIYTGLVR